jgi:hypothetical protein
MAIRVVFSCSIQERITSLATTMASRGTIAFHLRRVITTAVHPTSKVVGWQDPWRYMVVTRNPASLIYYHSR